MLKGWYKYLISIIAIVLLVAFQVSFLASLNGFWANFNIVLAFFVVLINIADYKKVLLFAIVAGLLMDIYSGLPFGIFLGTFFLLSAVLEILFLNFFTNHSYYSLLLMGLLSVIIYNIVFFAMWGILYLIGAADFLVGTNFWMGLVYQIISMGLLLSLSFIIVNAISRKFKPIFLNI